MAVRDQPPQQKARLSDEEEGVDAVVHVVFGRWLHTRTEKPRMGRVPSPALSHMSGRHVS